MEESRNVHRSNVVCLWIHSRSKLCVYPTLGSFDGFFFHQVLPREMIFMFSACEHNILAIVLFYLYRRTVISIT